VGRRVGFSWSAKSSRLLTENGREARLSMAFSFSRPENGRYKWSSFYIKRKRGDDSDDRSRRTASIEIGGRLSGEIGGGVPVANKATVPRANGLPPFLKMLVHAHERLL